MQQRILEKWQILFQLVQFIEIPNFVYNRVRNGRSESLILAPIERVYATSY